MSKTKSALERQNALLRRCYRAQCDLDLRMCDLSVQQIAKALAHISRARIIALLGV